MERRHGSAGPRGAVLIELQPWIDVSNYTQPFTASQLMWIRNGRVGVIIGLQDASKARDFRDQIGNIAPIDYYVDRMGRNLTIPLPGSRVWADVEPGCIYDADTLRIVVRHALPEAGLDPGWYGNLTSVRPVLGDSTEFADLPFWYADYVAVPIFDNFVAFNGIVRPEVWQYSDAGIPNQYTGGPYDLNCDLNFREVDVITRRSADGHFVEMTDPSGFVVYRWGSSDGSSGSRQSRPRNGDVSSPDHWEWLRTRKSGLTFWSHVEGD